MGMHIKILSILLFTAAMTVPQAYAGQDYIVTLTNGNTITANSYRLDGHKVYLKIPAGEVAIPASEVTAVTTGDGSALLLQVNGDLKPSSDRTQEAAPPQGAAIPGQPSEVQEPGPEPPEIGVTDNPGVSGPDESMDHRDKGTEAITGGVSGAVPSDGGVTGAPGGTSLDNNPADDGQAAEIRKRLDNNLDNLDGAGDSTNGAVDSTQQ